MPTFSLLPADKVWQIKKWEREMMSLYFWMWLIWFPLALVGAVFMRLSTLDGINFEIGSILVLISCFRAGMCQKDLSITRTSIEMLRSEKVKFTVSDIEKRT